MARFCRIRRAVLSRGPVLLLVLAVLLGACDSGGGAKPEENSSPTAKSDRYPAAVGAKLGIKPPGVLDNDSDSDGDNLTVNSPAISSPSNGRLTLNEDGSFEYTSEQGFTGEDSFAYEVKDGHGGTDQATVTIVVKDVEYAADIQPILENSCGGGQCHIQQSTSGVRLSSRDAVLNSTGSQYGTSIVEPGDATPSASPLVDKILPNPTFGQRMPRTGTPLTEAQISKIRAWIEGLAPDK